MKKEYHAIACSQEWISATKRTGLSASGSHRTIAQCQSRGEMGGEMRGGVEGEQHEVATVPSSVALETKLKSPGFLMVCLPGYGDIPFPRPSRLRLVRFHPALKDFINRKMSPRTWCPISLSTCGNEAQDVGSTVEVGIRSLCWEFWSVHCFVTFSPFTEMTSSNGDVCP